MTSRVRTVGAHESFEVSSWQMCATAPGAFETPAALDAASLTWVASTGGTAAATLRTAGSWSLDGPARRFDAEDWWFRTRLPRVDAEAGDELALCFDGLATIADVWLDGDHVLATDNMFRAYECPVAPGGGDLVLRFRALDRLLETKRPRPRWRAPMVEHPQLRWFRTTLLGRTPGWSPPAAPVGPWRPVRVERRRSVAIDEVRLRARLENSVGVVELASTFRELATPLGRVELIVERAGVARRVELDRPDASTLSGRIGIERPALWWPHTHGEPALYSARLEVEGLGAVDLGAIGFRSLERDGDFGLALNGVPVFCRGACWTPLDPVTLVSDRASYARALRQVRDAGMNMLRVGGTMVYETADFYDLCDELGILVWQDLMFANMDYPEDEAFVTGALAEVGEQLEGLQARPCLAVVCGNSEVEQQAAMWGATRERWSPPLFHESLARVATDWCPDAAYWPSSAHGGAFPHQPSSGTTSYYGVGAYLRPVDDSRRSEVRFATECLAFANVPEPDGLPSGDAARVHSAEWKARSPRDRGAGWDFDDVRDHYVAALFAVDPAALRYSDHDRYLALARVASGEVMAAAFGEWRRKRSPCRGALVWFLRDLWPGAGWGVVDARGVPKAAYYYLRRALASVALHVSDEGSNGLAIHASNDGPHPLACVLEVKLFRGGEALVALATHDLALAPHETVELDAATLFEALHDLSYAYRFGPPGHDILVASLRASGAVIAEAFHFPLGLPRMPESDLGLAAVARGVGAGLVDVSVSTRRFAQSIAVELDGYTPDDSYFHIAPGGERTIRLRRDSYASSPRERLQVILQPLNAPARTKVDVS